MNWRDWLPSLAAAVVGVGLGLFYAWSANPVEYVDTAPSTLRQSYRQDYLALIASAYGATGDLARAEARLSLFELDRPAEELTALAQRRSAGDGPASEAEALAQLAADLGQRPTPLAITQSPAATVTRSPASAASATPTRAATALPSRTPTAGPPFSLRQRQAVCQPALTTPLLQVEIADAAGNPVPGIEVFVLWDQGEDHFFTGLKPELGLGYGDFAMQPEVVYTVQLPQGADPVRQVQSEPCEAVDGASYPGSVLLIFEQPNN